MKVVHINLKEPLNGESDFYFGSLKAIYDSIPQDKVGIAYKSLTNALRCKSEYENKHCSIKVGHLKQKQQTQNN